MSSPPCSLSSLRNFQGRILVVTYVGTLTAMALSSAGLVHFGVMTPADRVDALATSAWLVLGILLTGWGAADQIAVLARQLSFDAPETR